MCIETMLSLHDWEKKTMSDRQCVRVQLVDDHDVVRIGFRYLLESVDDIQVVAESATGKQACLDYDNYRPDLVIMDISLPDISGLEAMRRILQKHPKARTLMLSMHSGKVAERALQMGARGFICKSSGANLLLTAIRTIMQGKRYLDHHASAQPIGPVDDPSKPPSQPLTRRELEVCILLSDGRSVGAIAAALHLSEKTVYCHRQHIMDKLGATTVIELAQVAARMGILTDG